MYKQEIKTKKERRECDICHRTVHYYIEQLRIDLCLPGKKIILANDLFTSFICLKCLTEEIKKVFVKDLKDNKKKNGNF